MNNDVSDEESCQGECIDQKHNDLLEIQEEPIELEKKSLITPSTDPSSQNTLAKAAQIMA
jgi:hypothetical protein